MVTSRIVCGNTTPLRSMGGGEGESLQHPLLNFENVSFQCLVVKLPYKLVFFFKYVKKTPIVPNLYIYYFSVISFCNTGHVETRGTDCLWWLRINGVKS